MRTLHTLTVLAAFACTDTGQAATAAQAMPERAPTHIKAVAWHPGGLMPPGVQSGAAKPSHPVGRASPA